MEGFLEEKSPCIYSFVITATIETAGPLTLFQICFMAMVAIAELRSLEMSEDRGKAIILTGVFDWLSYNAFSVSQIAHGLF